MSVVIPRALPNVLPPFASLSLVGRKAKPNLLIGHGETPRTFNIITKDEINDRTYSFCDKVLNPLLTGADATFVPVLNGAINFYSTISHMVNEGSHVELMPVHARSYGSGRKGGPVFISQDLIIPEKIKNRTLIVLDDVLETGKTVSELLRLLIPHQPARIVTVFLLRNGQQTPIGFQPDYWLFDISPESWVFGFGMDLAEKYRHLKYICDDNDTLYRYDGSPRY